MLELCLAVATLVVIVLASMFVQSLWAKVCIFLGLGVATCGFLWTQGEHAQHVVKEVFMVDYAQFIMIPVATVLIACLGLFALRAEPGQDGKVRLGWFLWLACPFIGNFATTWALVPAGLSLAIVLKKTYPDRWFRILIAVCAFSMNFLALGTLAADPPQAYWAVKAGVEGKPLGFFFPATQFWPYIVFTMGVYFVALRRFGVEFGHIRNLWCVRPASVAKTLYGFVIAGCVIVSVTLLTGYEVTWFLGGVCVIVALSAFVFFGSHERHQTVHWTTETVTIFVAFFSVVALAHAGLHHMEIPNQGMTGVVIGLTLFADNAAAFAAGYEQFKAAPEVYQVWYNLFNAVTYGGLSPLGNGPQIALFLIVLVHMKYTNAKEVFVVWFREACVFAPYLLVWTVGMTTLVELGFKPVLGAQILAGIIGMAVCFQFMDLQRMFRAHVDDEGNGA
jgi:hypothetical protein